MKRIRAAWRAFINPPKSGPIEFTLVTVDTTAAIIDAIRKHQRRRGQPPTV